MLEYLVYRIKNTIHRQRSRRVYLSFGENCLTDNILKRYSLKSFSTPFSFCRSNVEYILDLERSNYKNFLDEDRLSYGEIRGKLMPRLNSHLPLQNSYHHLHQNGIEFSLHDVIGDQKLRRKVIERADKLKSYLGRKKYFILYHHRLGGNCDPNLLLEHLSELKGYYSTQDLEGQVILFRQQIISSDLRKRLTYQQEKGVHIFDFHTHTPWTGSNPLNYWALRDDRLIAEMISKIRTL